MALIASTAKGSANSTSVTTDPIDTIGADLIVISVCQFNAYPAALTDSLGNTWTGINQSGALGFSGGIAHYYCLNPTTGAAHTFSNTGDTKPAIAVSAWSGAVSLQGSAGAGSIVGNSRSTGTVTPLAAGELIVTTAGFQNTGTVTVDVAFTVLDQVPYNAATNAGIAHAYAFAPSTSAIAATWTEPTPVSNFGCLIASFVYVEPPDPKVGCFILGGTDTGASNVDTTHTGYIALDDVARTVSGEGVAFVGGSIGLIEQATAPSGIANTALIYAIDNGSGKTKLMAQFGTGSAIQLSIEP
jgi:hypothetical protein